MHFLHLSLIVAMMQYIEGSMSAHFQVVAGVYKMKLCIVGHIAGFINLNIFACKPFPAFGRMFIFGMLYNVI